MTSGGWNKDLTKDNDLRVKKNAESISKALSGRIMSKKEKIAKRHSHNFSKRGQPGCQTGELNRNWKGGDIESRKRSEETRRNFSFIPINEEFLGCAGHHIDKDFVIYIPKELHQSIYHSVTKDINMKEMNEAAFAYTYREDRESFDAPFINILGE